MDVGINFIAKQRRTFVADRTLAAFVAIVLLPLAFLPFTQAIFNDGDTSWHVAAGRLILATGTIPDSDPFSFTFRGAAWHAHEWLAEVVMAGTFQAGSWAALGLLFGVAISALAFILALELRRWLPMRHVVAALVGIFIVLTPFVLARPHVLAWPLLAGWTVVLLRAREAGQEPPLAAALLMLVWANLHASFLFGLGLAGLFTLEALIHAPDRRAALIGWAGFGVAALLAALATPHGVQVFLYPVHVSGMESLPLIMEWRAVDPAKDWLFLALLAGVAVLAVSQRVRVPPVRLILLLALVYLSFQHVRHQPLLAIVGTLLLAEPFARPSGQAAPHPPMQGTRYAAAALLVGFLLLAALRLTIDLERRNSPSNPLAAIEQLPAGLRARPVLNSYGFGGPLILNGIRPYIDGRADMYGDAFTFEHNAIVNGDMTAFRRAVSRWRIGWTILSPDTTLARRLDREAGWRRLYRDHWAVVHVAR